MAYNHSPLITNSLIYNSNNLLNHIRLIKLHEKSIKKTKYTTKYWCSLFLCLNQSQTFILDRSFLLDINNIKLHN